MIEPYKPPSRWWRRNKDVRVTLWPLWLAQHLCPHKATHPVGWNDDGSEFREQCEDCYKWIPSVREGGK